MEDTGASLQSAVIAVTPTRRRLTRIKLSTHRD